MAPHKNHTAAKCVRTSSNESGRILWFYLEVLGANPETMLIGCFFFGFLLEFCRFMIAAPSMERTLIRAD